MDIVSQELWVLGFKFHSHKISVVITVSGEKSKNQIYMVAFPETLSQEVSNQTCEYTCF